MNVPGWRLMRDGPLEGAVNMAVDQALLKACETGRGTPTLRLYGWARPTLSIGYAQNLERDIDLAGCAREGIPIVRRPTGGRALLHDREVTYSLIAPVDHPAFGTGLKGALASISGWLMAGLALCGVPREAMQAANGARPARAAVRSPVCFATLNQGEITVSGKKLIGSAQRRTHKAFLQHGSLLLDQDVDHLTRLCRYASEAVRLADADRLRQSCVSLTEICGRPVAFDEVTQALVLGFQQGLAGPWQAGELSADERELRDAFLEGS